ncbi:MAG: DUF885 domain-containing protein [Verrucomicrobiales bacterium]|nr:DUF885 domain-containing protein [Verrucomicrobiales bacterium]
MNVLRSLINTGAACLSLLSLSMGQEMNQQFDTLAKDYVDQFPTLSPVQATQVGDHRYDSELDDVSETGRLARRSFHQSFLDRLGAIDLDTLSKDRQVDAALLKHSLSEAIWSNDVLQEWAWNPTQYTQLTGGAIYGLMAREFAPIEKRLQHAADRLEKMPHLFEQIRVTLVPDRVPAVHAETAVKQNRGLLSIMDDMIIPKMGSLDSKERKRLEDAMASARAALEVHETWLKEKVVTVAKANFRIGAELFDQKLSFALQTPLTRLQVKERADAEFKRCRKEMYDVSKRIYLKQHPFTAFPEKPSEDYRQAIIRSGLEITYQDAPTRDGIVKAAEEQVAYANQFIKDNHIVTPATEPLEIILMPVFQRGVSFAYCDSPGPLDRGLRTYYAVSPIPEDWTDTQVKSFLREYNTWSMHDLSMHEAIPGHYLQLAHANKYPSTLRALLSSGTFIEGWAVYSERVMVDAGYLDGDDRMRLINLKWYLRGITNAMIDQAIHVDGMTEEEAMRLMIEGGFQEEREAAGKWTRAQLTSAQLSTYFVGTLEHWDLRREMEKVLGKVFNMKTYHDKLLSFGSPPVQFVKALMLDLPIPK